MAFIQRLTAYSYTNADELFAECFALYRAGRVAGIPKEVLTILRSLR